MEAELQAQIAFHLTGRKTGDKLVTPEESGLRPALLAGFRDLTRLRYDFPLVLIENGTDETSVRSLSGLFDSILQDVAAGADGERLKQHALRLEQEIRALAADGVAGSLHALWERAASRLGKHNDELFQDSLRRLRAALKIDGEVVDCDGRLPFRLLQHAWTILRSAKARKVRKDIDRLIMKLSDVLAADVVHSEKGLSAENLKASMGTAQRDAFDFEAMAHLLVQASPKTSLAEARRRRIEWLLKTLKSQRFFPAAAESQAAPAAAQPYEFVFENCAQALEAYRARQAGMTELAKAIAMAGLEAEGRYNGSKHDVFFAEFGANGLGPDELAIFPDYLLCVDADEVPNVLKAFAAGLPAKVLVQTDDLLETSASSGEHIALALGGKQLAATAIGLGSVYVLQSTSSNLLQLRDQIFRGFAYAGPALFNIFSGATDAATGLPPYLTAAAALESRAFPSFVFDPSAGPDLAARFQVQGNPQADHDWPLHSFAYEDEEHQRAAEDLAFTLVDFIACDRRHAMHFARVPRAKWNGSMAPAVDFIAGASDDLAEKVPSLLMVDANNELQRVIVDAKLIREARHCADTWRNLRELGGIRNSHAERLLAKERQAWAEQLQHETKARANGQSPGAEAPVAAPTASAAPAAAPAPAKEAPQAEAQSASDDPYIETPRCTTCNECTQINNRMFAYNDDKQAYIADPDAGTYAQLVEAAENCQVAIIHPGKPRNPNEPGLDELMKRAEDFL
jgi:ferredoxin